MKLLEFFKNLFTKEEKHEIQKITVKEFINEPSYENKDEVVMEIQEEPQIENDEISSEELNALYTLKMSIYQNKKEESDKKFRNLLGQDIEEVKKDLKERYPNKIIEINNIEDYNEEHNISRQRVSSGDKFSIQIFKDKDNKAIVIVKCELN